MNDPKQDIADGIAELKRRKKAEEIPDRQLVRVLLLGLGKLAMSEGEADTRALAKSISEATADHDRWAEALDSEMMLAVAEHVQGVDPKFLDLPSYDFAYTIAARERLEQRLKALELLEHRIDERLLDQIAEADARLHPYLERG